MIWGFRCDRVRWARQEIEKTSRPHLVPKMTTAIPDAPNGLPDYTLTSRRPREDRVEAVERIEAGARDLSRANGRFTIQALSKHLGLSKAAVAPHVHALVADGKAVFYGPGNAGGYGLLGLIERNVNLADLTELARASVKEDATAPRGRRSSLDHRRVSQLTKDQLEKIETVAALIAESVPGAGNDPRRVTAEHFRWDPRASGGSGDWEIASRARGGVREWSDRRAAARGKGNGSLGAHLGSVRLLLNLAATHGLLSRAAQHTPEFETHAPEWVSLVMKWRRRLVRITGGRSQSAIETGLRLLARYATRRGELTVNTVDWAAVRLSIIADHAAGTLRDDQLLGARTVWRIVVERYARRLKWPASAAWSTMRDHRLALVSEAAVKAAVQRAQFDGWVLSSAAACGVGFATGLVEGPFGLRGWLLWAMSDALELKRLSLPPRAWPNPTPSQAHQLAVWKRKKKDGMRLNGKTAVSRLHNVSRLAGWARSYRGVDWTQQDLRALCDPTLVLEYRAWLRAQPNGKAGRRGVDEIALTLSKIASPYLEHMALREAERERKLGNAEAADALDADARVLHKRAAELREIGYEIKPPKEAPNEQKDTPAIIEAWGADGRDGWLKLLDLRDLIVAEAVEPAGATSLVEQIAAIEKVDELDESGRPTFPSAEAKHAYLRTVSWRSMAWAKLIQGAFFINLARKVPLRADDFSDLRLDWFSCTDSCGRQVDPWHPEAAITISIPRLVMKNGKPFRPAIIRRADVGRPAMERGVCRPLWKLYLMPNGARDVLLTARDDADRPKGARTRGLAGRVVASPYVMPAALAWGGGGFRSAALRAAGGCRWGSRSLSSYFARTMARYADRLGVDSATVSAMWGADGIHIIRALFGRYFVHRDPVMCSLMLHHGDMKTTLDLYAKPNPSDASLEATEAEMR